MMLLYLTEECFSPSFSFSLPERSLGTSDLLLILSLDSCLTERKHCFAALPLATKVHFIYHASPGTSASKKVEGFSTFFLAWNGWEKPSECQGNEEGMKLRMEQNIT